jgi:Zn-dependent protease with chaperone function
MSVILVLAAGWLLLALLSTPRARTRLLRLPPLAAAGAFLAIAVGLVLVPITALMVSLSAALFALGGSGSTFTRCGRLIAALAHDPLARPDISLVLALTAVMLGRLVLGAVTVWGSQCRTGSAVRGASDRLVIESSMPLAFTAGLIRPRVVVSRTFLEEVPGQWQSAVLAHEEAHRKGRHPCLYCRVDGANASLPLHAPSGRWCAVGTRRKGR